MSVAVKIAEHVLLPRLRSGGGRCTLVLANGFSCREQMEQLTGRETLHMAEAVAERLGLAAERPAPPRVSTTMLLAIVAGAALAAGARSAIRPASAGGFAARFGNRALPLVA